jgi:hypothetical protein
MALASSPHFYSKILCAMNLEFQCINTFWSKMSVKLIRVFRAYNMLQSELHKADPKSFLFLLSFLLPKIPRRICISYMNGLGGDSGSGLQEPPSQYRPRQSLHSIKSCCG